MSAQHPFLNQETLINASYINMLFDKGVDLIDDATQEIEKIARNVLPPPDFTGLTPALIDPSSVAIGIMPDRPIKPVLGNVPIDPFPSPPILTTDQLASDALISATISKIVAWLDYRMANPTGLSIAVETAIFGRGIDRESKLYRNLTQNYLNENSSAGWASPAGQDKAARIRLSTEKAGKISDINRDIIIKQADLEQNNTQKTLELWQTLQTQLFNQKQADESNKVHLFDSLIKSVIDKAQVYINVNRAYIDIFNSEVQAYKALSDATLDEARFRTDQIASLNAMNTHLATVSMEKLKVLMQYQTSNAGIATEGSKAIAAVLGQLSANLMNAINLGISNSYGHSWQYSESINI